jgi:dTDP-4-dehydrorhamnose 3,5-epimerase
VLSETADFLYKCSEVYHPEDERGIAWNDPDLAISWAVSNPLISDKDARWPTLAKIPPEELPPYMPTNR